MILDNYTKDREMFSKDFLLSSIGINTLDPILHQYNLTIQRKSETKPFAVVFTDSKHHTILRVNPWDEIDSVTIKID